MMTSIKAHWRLTMMAGLFGLSLLLFHGLVETPRGASFDYNLSWFEAFRTAFWQGDLYPRHTTELWYGHGGLDFYFYGPLPFWFASIVGEIGCPGCGTSQAFSIAAAWMLILSGISFFIFARRFFAPAWAGFGAMLYVVLPFHYLINWYIGQTIGAIMALAILPILALAICQMVEDRKGGPLFAFSFAALALSHLPSTMIISHLILVLAVWTALTKYRERREQFALLFRFLPWTMLGIALSAFYWMPAIGLLSSVSADMLYSDYYDSTRWLLLDGVPENDPFKTQKFKLVLILVVVSAIAASLVLKTRRTPSMLLLWILVPSAFAAFAMTFVSYPMWKFWIINKVQFPDRALVVTDLSIALAAIVLIKYALSHAWRASSLLIKVALGATGFAFVAAFALPLGQSHQIIQESRADASPYLPVAPLEYIPPTFKQRALERFRTRDLDGVANADRFYFFFDEVEAGFQNAQAAFEQDAPNATLQAEIHDRFTLQLPGSTAREIRLPVPYWPHWRAYGQDGRPLSISEDPDLGIIQLSAPAGVSEITLELIETRPQKIGSSLSLGALFIFLVWLMAPRAMRLGPFAKPLETSLP